MGDPLDFLRTAEVGTLIAITGAAGVTVGRVFPSLAPRKAHRGMVALQLAWTKEKADAVIGFWRKRNREQAAKRAVYIDFAFIVFYSFGLGVLAVIAGRAAHAGGLLAGSDADTFGAALAIAGWVAGFCDCVENGGLLLMLSGRTSQPLPGATSLVSSVKWLLAAGSLLGSLGLLVASLIDS
jgi:hypothetical protein